MPTINLPTCRYCSNPAYDLQSLAVFDPDDRTLIRFNHGNCLAHKREALWSDQRPTSGTCPSGCPECGHYNMEMRLDWASAEVDTGVNTENWGPYWSSYDISEWDLTESESVYLDYQTYFEYVVEHIFVTIDSRERRSLPQLPNPLRTRDGRTPEHMQNFLEDDEFEYARSVLSDSLRLHAWCENCEHTIPTQWD